ncbi:hypothetical protein MUP77_22080 [Candidatus Bathyarchaeota archaeon]|nr:hypothetical protein [Candidatus Bathyarchaeota archaeon]
MFWKKKQSDDYEDEEPERKEPDRRLFGFRCSPAIKMTAKVLAKKLHVDLYELAEHSIQLGLMDVAAVMKDPKETEMLREHLNEEHVINHLVESVSRYDAEAARYIREGQARRYHKELAVRALVELWARYGLDPRLMEEIILGELQRITAARRSRARQNDYSAGNTGSRQNPPDTADGTNEGSGGE